MLTEYKSYFRKPMEFIGLFFIRAGFTPNGITLLSLSLGILTCLFYIWNKNAVLFGILMIIWGLFDFVDGTVARMTNHITKFGAYLDAMCDRVFESTTLFAVAYVSGYWKLAFVMGVGIFLISYAKARAAMEVPIINNEWPDLMERTERDIIFIMGVILWGIFPGQHGGHDILFWVFVRLNLAIYYTFIQRLFRAKKIIQARQ